MADFEAILRKTLGGMVDPSPEAREKVYERARAAIGRQIDGLPKRPPETVVKRQYEKLEAAVALIEKEYGVPEEPDPFEVSLVDSPPAKKAPAEDPLAAFLAEQEAETERTFRKPREGSDSKGDAKNEIKGETKDRPKAKKKEAKTGGAGRSISLPTSIAGKKPLVLAGVALGVLIVAGAVGYAALSVFSSDDDAVVTQVNDDGLPVREVPSTTVTMADTDNGDEAADTAPSNGDGEQLAFAEGPEKFTQRLTPEGREIDEGPAMSSGAGGEGTTVSGQSTGDGAVASAGQSDTAPSQAGTQPAALPVGQRAIFYQERTGTQAGTAEAGATIWSVVQESPGGDAPPEPAIRAEASIPDLGLTMEMTIRRNIDETFPASHVIELLFRVPETFEGRGITDVQRITFKGTEQDPGNALIGVAAPLDTNIFLIALTDAQTATETNLNLMRREQWIDIPMQYVSGRRALITLEKGIPGEQVFNEVLASWDQAAQSAQN
ncbi:hypothetical protein [Oricola sp.]|uniref:hypothetical protein n=1 Tax=Oricola sp. TaxID=1979950 RepID=UPI0025E57F49|nr:hypothetical protein [Oricola sp.]MCI5074591.1 hypothetical protein [Oricola sp.]